MSKIPQCQSGKINSFQPFDGFIGLHIGENQVEEDRHSKEEDELKPQRDETSRLRCLLSVLT